MASRIAIVSRRRQRRAHQDERDPMVWARVYQHVVEKPRYSYDPATMHSEQGQARQPDQDKHGYYGQSEEVAFEEENIHYTSARRSAHCRRAARVSVHQGVGGVFSKMSTRREVKTGLAACRALPDPRRAPRAGRGTRRNCVRGLVVLLSSPSCVSRPPRALTRPRHHQAPPAFAAVRAAEHPRRAREPPSRAYVIDGTVTRTPQHKVGGRSWYLAEIGK